jgi:hypothetical protein
MPADNEHDPLDRWLNQQVRPLPPPPGTFELISRRARRRKLRRAAVSVASAAAVAAAVAIAVPVGLSLHLTPTSSTGASLAAGNSATGSGGSPSTLGSGTRVQTPGASSAAASASASGTPGVTTPGYLPPNFQPYSVTWDSLTTGWIMGPAGTPGHCGAQQNSSICTSIARTSDSGHTWHGLPAPPVGGPEALAGVTGLRFLNASYGWAFGPELWATDDGGEHWHQVNTGGASVTDLETASGRAFALFAACAPPAGTTGDTIANCTSSTLETATAGSDAWTPVAGVPAGLTVSSITGTATGTATSGTTGTTTAGSAVIELAGAAGAVPATGYLVAPDGTLYAGPLNGAAWHRVAALPCSPGAAASNGLPRQVLLAPDGIVSASAARLAVVCAVPSGSTVVYLSVDGGENWTEQTGVGSAGTSLIGDAQSLTALTDGTLILATEGNSSSPGGIYLLPPGASKWQAATLSDPSAAQYGFSYVGMTSPRQGVALSGDPALHEIWMTTDRGQTWQPRPIQS